MPQFEIITYSTSDNDQSDIQTFNKEFDNIEDGIEYILDGADVNKEYSEIYHNEPNRVVILLDTKHYDKDGNEIVDNWDDLDESNNINYMAEIELIPDNDNNQVSTE